jgi:hypothetical protein
MDPKQAVSATDVAETRSTSSDVRAPMTSSSKSTNGNSDGVAHALTKADTSVDDPGRESDVIGVGKRKEEPPTPQEKSRWPWLQNTVLPVVLTGFVGFIFGDSLRARTHADIAISTMHQYFDVPNTNVGKRKEVLRSLLVLTQNDTVLSQWAKLEMARVENQDAKLNATIAALESDIQALRADLVKRDTTLRNNGSIVKDTEEKNTRLEKLLDKKEKELERCRENAAQTGH